MTYCGVMKYINYSKKKTPDITILITNAFN